ncbi:MAG: YraN family protein, partial [Woeseiaceae bacterium]|nr:YraN family protein [Woeseiaceae bacterium]
MVRLDRQSLGKRKEKEALRFLQQRGLELVERNFRSRFGEIDLVMRDEDCLVVVEVRYR